MNLKSLRNKIDKIDAELVKLMSERALISQSIGKLKINENKGIYSPNREKEVLDNVKRLNQGPMPNDAVAAVYREIMSASLALEKPLKIANLGNKGSFSSIAARRRFGSQIEYVTCNSIPDVFHRVETGECDYGVAPIENSTEGAVTYTYDALIDTELKVCSQVLVKISNCLCSFNQLDKIKKIYSHPQVFAQCKEWLRKNLPAAEQIWVSSTTEAMRLAAKDKKSAAAGSVEAAQVYRLPIIRKNIQDAAHNTTRFLIIGQEDASPSGDDRTSILFSIKDKVGALYNMLKPFYDNKINLTKIESRPSKKKAWDYLFFVDFLGHRDDPKVKKALVVLDRMCKYLKILGSYPVIE
jgi:chorismate mutase/prephenate dehydratase